MILCFSGTGNSRYAAERIGKRIDDEVISINGMMRSGRAVTLASERPFVIVCPTYAWRIPRVVADFLLKADFSGNKDAFFVMTCGDDIGNARGHIGRLCEAKGLRLHGVASVVMPENYVALYDVPETAEIEKIMGEADGALEAVSGWIAGEGELTKAMAQSPGFTILASLKSGILNSLFYAFVVNARGFRSTEACTACGACVGLCPLKNVSLINGRPVWGESCTHCMACICGCPSEAIEYKRHTPGKPRYYNSRKG